MKHVHANQHGFSLIEVLVAVLVFSLGLIGLAGLLVMSTQANHGSFIRTQATFVAQNLADRMRANPIGVWRNNYNFTVQPAVASTTSAPTCNSVNPCNPTQVAQRDQAQWSALLAQYLPVDNNLVGSVFCARPVGSPTYNQVPDFAAKQPPYDGVCAMRITWTERNLGIGIAAANQTFNWVFQP